ncbi:GNAT family N-acetyltransferase [Oscillospiraceae bacterium OttesenSCG-928-G22]|nr:GNAT family N-acetyltransferase [Oscillospiraceae bacterium OttesenSCG-928-G22]
MQEDEKWKERAVEILEITRDKKAYLPLLLLADPSEDMVDRYLERGRLFVLFSEGEALSCAVVTREDETTCELKNLATREDHWRRGLASSLLTHLFSLFAERFDTMLVGTGDEGLFYQKHGFAYSHTLPDFFVANYPEPIIENGVRLRDMIYLKRPL